MKRLTFTTLSSLTLLTAAAAFAQSDLPMRANIPFDFRVGKAILPAGLYTVRPGGVTGCLSIRRVDGKGSAMAQTFGADARKGSTATTGTLLFNRYGDTYFLAKVWNADSAEGRQIVASKVERELARNSSLAPRVNVVLAKK